MVSVEDNLQMDKNTADLKSRFAVVPTHLLMVEFIALPSSEIVEYTEESLLIITRQC